MIPNSLRGCCLEEYFSASALVKGLFFGLCLYSTKEVCQRFSVTAIPKINVMLLILF